MNQNSPDYYTDKDEETSKQSDLEVIDYIKTVDPTYEIVSPILPTICLLALLNP